MYNPLSWKHIEKLTEIEAMQMRLKSLVGEDKGDEIIEQIKQEAREQARYSNSDYMQKELKKELRTLSRR